MENTLQVLINKIWFIFEFKIKLVTCILILFEYKKYNNQYII